MLSYTAGAEAGFERRAAEATLLVLREAVKSTDPAFPHAYYWLPYLAPAEREQVLDFLMRAPKTLTCVALDIAGGLAIGTWPTFGSRWPADRDGHEKSVKRMFEGLPVPGEGEEQVMIVGSTGEVRLTYRELRLWEAAYDLPMTEIVYGEDDDDRA